MTSSTSESFIYAVAGTITSEFITKLENGVGTATPEQRKTIQDQFNTACLKGANINFSINDFRFERFADGIIVVKCPRIGEAYHVPDDSKVLKKWEYEQILEQAKPSAPAIKPFAF